MSDARDLLADLLEPRLDARARAWRASAVDEIASGPADARFAALLSMASRHARALPLAPSAAELARASRVVRGFSPERWSLRTALRASLVLARTDLAQDSGERALEDAFRCADEGELVALYATLALVPEPQRFTWRAGEGCRTNMRTVFEAVACDTPFPARFFDDVAWNQCVVKCVFVGAPLWRVWGLDDRLSPELARMALDLADERRSAGRPVQHELWLALGAHGGARARDSLLRELEHGTDVGRAAAAYGLARAGETELVAAHLERERDPRVQDHLRKALSGACDQRLFRELERFAANS